MMTMHEETITIDGEEYYRLPVATKIVRASGLGISTDSGLKNRLIRMGKELKTRPGSNRIYVKKSDIDYLIGG